MIWNSSFPPTVESRVVQGRLLCLQWDDVPIRQHPGHHHCGPVSPGNIQPLVLLPQLTSELQVSLSCEDMSGVASIAIKLEETCPPPYQDIEDKIDILDTKINEVLANQEDCGAPGGGEGGEGDCWCGARMSRSRIVGGQDADINEHPWQAGIVCVTESCAVLGGLDRPFCGGSLVNSKESRQSEMK